MTIPTRRAFVLGVLLMLGAVAVGGVGIAPAAGATQGDVATACQLDRASPETVGDLRERAQQRVSELQRLDSESAVAVDQAKIETLADRVQNGNISYDRARYQRACGHYQIALEQSTATLERHYTTLAEIRLASVENHIEERRAADYDSMKMSNLSARHEVLAAQTANVSSLSQAQSVASEAAELQADASELPKMRVVQAATTLAPIWRSIPIGVGLTLVIGGFGAFVGRLTADTTDTDEDGNESDDIETRQRFDSTE